MGKKRITKKRTTRRQKPKTQSKDKLQQTTDNIRSAVNGQMSKLEYEQSLMDPRFKAAMMGFNNPNNYNQIYSNELRRQENKTNELSRQLAYQAEKHAYEKQIQTVTADLAAEKARNAEQQERFKQEQAKKQAEHDLAIVQLKKEHSEEIHRVEGITKDLVRTSDLENFKYSIDQKLKDAINAKEKAEIRQEYEPKTRQVNAEAQEIINKLDLLSEQMNAIQEFKQAQHKLNKTKIKQEYQPKIQQLESDNQDMENTLALNKELFDQQAKQNEAKIKNAQLKQKIDPQVSTEYFEKYKEAKLETHKLQQTNVLAERVFKVHEDNEDLTNSIIDKASRIFQDFKVDDLNSPEFNKKLNDKYVQLRNQYVENLKKLNQADRTYKYQQKIEDAEFEYAEAQARINVLSKESPGYIKTINDAAKQRQTLLNDIDRYKKIEDDIKKVIDEKSETIEGAHIRMQNFLNDNPYVKQEAESVALQARGKKDIHLDDMINAIDNVIHKTNQIIQNNSSLQEKQGLANHIQQLTNENTRLKASQAEAQKKAKQYAATTSFYNARLVDNNIHLDQNIQKGLETVVGTGDLSKSIREVLGPEEADKLEKYTLGQMLQDADNINNSNSSSTKRPNIEAMYNNINSGYQTVAAMWEDYNASKNNPNPN